MQHIKTPVDLISLPCISPAQAQQAIDTAYPFDKQGFIIWSDTAPDVVADPVLAYFLWGKTTAGVKPVDVEDLEISYYNGTSWQLIPFKILPGSVKLTDISLVGPPASTANYIIQVNSSNTALIWTSIITAIANGTLPPDKLLVPNNTDTFILSAFAGSPAFTELLTFFAAIVDSVIPVTKLIKGAADPLGFYLRTKIDGTSIEWANVDVANLAASGSVANQAIRRNAGNTAWEYYTPSTANVIILNNGGSLYAVPGSAASTAIAHGQAAVPSISRVVLVRQGGGDGYSAGDELDITSITVDIDGTNQQVAFMVTSDATNITVACVGYATGINYCAKGGGPSLPFTAADWKLKAYIIP